MSPLLASHESADHSQSLLFLGLELVLCDGKWTNPFELVTNWNADPFLVFYLVGFFFLFCFFYLSLNKCLGHSKSQVHLSAQAGSPNLLFMGVS